MARAKKAKAKRKAAAKPAKKKAAAKRAKPAAKKAAKSGKRGAAKRTPMPRAAKGKRPQYFEDPAVDKLHLMVMALIEELSVTRDRLDTVERLIEKHGLFQVQEIEDFFPDLKADGERMGRRIAYIRRVMKGITDELENLHGQEPAMEFDEVVDVISR
jgi:chemotaxis protein histidine kinase CheA